VWLGVEFAGDTPAATGRLQCQLWLRARAGIREGGKLVLGRKEG
jgi:hypothetical protein